MLAELIKDTKQESPQMKKTLKTLIIEDDPNDFILLEIKLKQSTQYSFDICHKQTLKELKLININDYDLVFLDLNLSDGCSNTTLNYIFELNIQTPIIIFTHNISQTETLKSANTNIVDFIMKDNLTSTELDKKISFLLNKFQYNSDQIDEKEKEVSKTLTAETAHHINNSLMVLSFITETTKEIPADKKEKIDSIINRLRSHSICMMLFADECFIDPKDISLLSLFEKLKLDLTFLNDESETILNVDFEKFKLLLQECPFCGQLIKVQSDLKHVQISFERTPSPGSFNEDIYKKAFSNLLDFHKGKFIFKEDVIEFHFPI